MKINTNITKLFHATDKRSGMLRINIMFSAILRVIGLLCSLIIVPITLNYLNNEVYGIWLTISSILYWIAFFDIGLGNGMRNYLTQAISQNDYTIARSYISTSFILLCGIAVIMGIIATIVLSILDMNVLFNTTTLPDHQLRIALCVAVIFTLIQFVLKNIGLIFVALQKYAIYDLLSVSGQVLALFIIYILTKTTTSNLIYIVMAFTILPVMVYSLAAIPVFIKYPQLKPTIKCINMNYAHNIVGKGLGFFLIQITSCLIIYGSSNLFITRFYGPESVTTYNIAYKYFYMLAIGYTIIVAPMWNAYTDAYVKGDTDWIRKTFHHAISIWGLTVIAGAIMLSISSFCYNLWVGDTVTVPLSVSLYVFAYICAFNFNCCVTALINGLNKIRVQIYTSFIFTIVYLFVVMNYGGKYGINSIIGAMAACYCLMAVIHLYQCRLLINNKATGVWNK